MNPADPNIRRVEQVARALGDLCDDLILVGGCAASLLIDAPTAPLPRVTHDVDLIAAVAALRDYHALERRFALRGFQRDTSPDAPICRWQIDGIAVDLMPIDDTVLGFSNRWYAEAAASAMRLTLPGGTPIHLISAPAFLATKFEAFHTRGRGDLLQSHDFEDIINVVEGRRLIVEEISAGSTALRHFLAARFAVIIAMPDFMNVLPGLVAYDELHSQRLTAVMNKMAAIAAMASP